MGCVKVELFDSVLEAMLSRLGFLRLGFRAVPLARHGSVARWPARCLARVLFADWLPDDVLRAECPRRCFRRARVGKLAIRAEIGEVPLRVSLLGPAQ